jgi:acyl transferase domain-containing protein
VEKFSSGNFDDADIAIIGMAGRFPGADNVERFWANLRDGVESIRFLTEEECRAGGVEESLLKDPSYVRAAAFLDGPEGFDAPFFDMPPREAEITDPQHRAFLECAWEALEHAGYAAREYPGSIGVYGGATLNTYLLLNLARNPQVLRSLEPVQLNIGNGGDFLTTRVAYKLNLKGPSHAVQSACSTSLVAVHVACQSLLNEECDIALAGGVSINLTQRHGYRYVEGGMASPDGHCRPFEAKARGTLFGSGVGMVVLKRLRAAVEDGDTIHAIIKGTAINNDGSLKAGYTAPGLEGQAQVITEALGASGLRAEDISYVEAHGTATPLGDPIEVQALTRAFRATSRRTRHCALGSVKSNIGHLDAAAGVTGLLKVVLSLQNQQLPPTLHFEQPNPALELDGSPFYVNATLQPWPSGSTPRRAGVSSFGVGGTNAHVVLEEAPRPQPGSGGREWKLLPLSARTRTALDAATERLASWLERNPTCDLQDVAWTLQAGRERFEHRRFLLARDVAEAVSGLRRPEQPPSTAQARGERSVVFLFPGQGTQHVNMGLALYRAEPLFRAEVDRCATLLTPRLGVDLRTLLYPARPEDAEECGKKLAQTALTQPALFTLEYATAKLWMSWGVEPEAMIGHSIGEYVAACLAGVFTLEDALRLVAVRGRLMQGLPSGAMLAVPLAEEEVQPYLHDELSLAAVNAPMQCVLSGTHAAVEKVQRQLSLAGVRCQPLVTSHAFHSSMMEPILPEFMAQVASARPRTPERPFISNLTGTWVTPEQARSPEYWAQHLRRAVRFEAGLRVLLAEPKRVLLEVGPAQVLSRLARRHPAHDASRVVVPSMPSPQDTPPAAPLAYEALGRLWQAGVTLDWEGFHPGERRRRVALPTYPFERQRYWVEPTTSPAALLDAAPQAPAHPEAPAPAAPAPQRTLHPRPELRTPFVAAGNELERKLATIWQEVLGVASIGVEDNFFDLGGDSLLAIQISERLKKDLGADVAVSGLYEGVTVRALTKLLNPEPATPAEDSESDERQQRRKQNLERQRSRRRGDDEDEG